MTKMYSPWWKFRNTHTWKIFLYFVAKKLITLYDIKQFFRAEHSGFVKYTSIYIIAGM